MRNIKRSEFSLHIPQSTLRTEETPILAFPLDRGKGQDVTIHILVCFPPSYPAKLLTEDYGNGCGAGALSLPPMMIGGDGA
jgi:hypothetical protein